MLRKLTSEFLEQSGYFGTCPTDILMGEDAETGRFGNLPQSPSYYVAEAEFELTVNTQTPQPSQSS